LRSEERTNRSLSGAVFRDCHAIGSDPDNRVVIVTGSGEPFMETISPKGFDFFMPQGYD
jgi:hypothetical protein